MSTVIWHDLECGRYEQDLPLWLGLAAEYVQQGQAMLDVGAGTGRVTIPIAQAGYRVLALDINRHLLVELERRAPGLPVETVCADAREFELADRAFGLIAVPMQTLQLLGGADGHFAFMRRARAHLRDGGIVAVAIADVGDFEEFEWHDGDASPLPDVTEHDGWAYFSQPTAVRRKGDTFVLERRREAVDAHGARSTSADRIALDVVSVQGLQEAGQRAGLHPHSVRQISPTEEHIGSQVVIFSA
jgi:SAM-dependent methyltransferase